ncbi:hypothetical protein MHJ94_11555 [Chryseobacterium taklimakanense]|uniref:hypothetical protein n=1 Tax=Chryseobacterium taklimakanense TaxID=536441 RepID=UPI001EF530C2|nr:hypothetical protein [Chryseobacterium taklimakanense]MCG7281926.1 hypothetical protein [Chryseobacterium taklimakanense]
MENQNTTPNEPQSDIYELLKKVVETNEENIKSTKQVESVHREAQNFYQTAQNAIIGSTNMMQKAMQLVRTELESIIGFKTSIPESIPADLSENTVNFFEKIEKHIQFIFPGSIGILSLAVIIFFGTNYFAFKWYSESIRAKSEIRQEILDEIKKDGKAIYKVEDYNQLRYNTDLMNKWMKKNPRDGEKFLRFKEGYESK